MGEYKLDTLAEKIRHYGPEKLADILHFSGISSVADYSDEQLERMYKLAHEDENYIAHLKNHDVAVVVVNREGDHNGISSEVASRLDDDHDRMLFFEISDPRQVYKNLKKLHDLGIKPSTLIFASHGAAGQFAIAEKPPLDEHEVTAHVTSVHDQNLLEVLAADDDKLVGYDVAQANGLIRGIQRFMQPSRAIDDPKKDEGRKKIISLSCEFDAEANRAVLNESGEKEKVATLSLMQRLGEVLVDRLKDEHIDLYGADISTNKQTRTKHGFHYNTMRGGRHSPYTASIIQIDGDQMQRYKLNEVQLRQEGLL